MTVEVKQQPSAARKLHNIRSSPTFILVTVCVAIFNDVFLFGTVIPALPYALPHRVKINPDDVQIWIGVLLAAYGGALLVGSLVFGWLGDRMPRRHGLLVFGIVCLLSATVLIAVGRHIVLLILGRFFQGLAAAVVWTSGLALLTDLFGKERYGEAVGYGQTSVSIGTTTAPLLGGVAYARGGFNAVSGMSIGVVAFSLVLVLLMIEPQDQAYDNFPPKPSMTKVNTNNSDVHPEHIMATTTIEPMPHSPDERSFLIPKLAKTAPDSNRVAYPVLLRSGRILAAMGGLFAYSFVIISFEGLIPLFVKDTFHWNSENAALTFLAWIIPGLLGPVAGRASDRFGSRWVAIGGFSFTIVPLLLMRLVTKNTLGQKVLLCALLGMVGFGLVWTLSASLSDLTAAAADLKAQYPHEFGDAGAMSQAFGLFVFAYSCGTFVGPTVVGITKAKLNWGAATIILALTCFLTCVPIFFKTPAISRKRREELEAA